MRIEDITIVLRPRRGWEAIDLGFALGRNHFLQLWLLWWMSAFPIFCLWHVLFYDDGPLPFLLFWWCKPLYEQALLFYLSRATFGEYLSVEGVRQNFFSIVRTQLFALLTWRRFSFSRSADMAVHILEGLSGTTRKQRLTVLQSYSGQTSNWLTIVLYHFEVLLWIGFIVLIGMMVPDEVEFFSDSGLWAGESVYYDMLNSLLYVMAMSLVAPFYVSAGFALYLSARTRLEGWDVELAFRKLVRRLVGGLSRTAVVLSCSSVLLLSFTSEDAVSKPVEIYQSSEVMTPEKSRERIREVLAGPDYGEIELSHTWKLRKSLEEKPEEVPSEFWVRLFKWLGEVFSGVAMLTEIALWVVVIGLILWFAHKYALLRRFFALLDQVPRVSHPVTKSNLIRSLKLESLPVDILQSVKTQIDRGDYRAALSLLYRGSLRIMVKDHQLKIPESATESECIWIVNLQRPGLESQYFKKLTNRWLYMAWAGKTPDTKELAGLTETWESIYGQP